MPLIRRDNAMTKPLLTRAAALRQAAAWADLAAGLAVACDRLAYWNLRGRAISAAELADLIDQLAALEVSAAAILGTDGATLFPPVSPLGRELQRRKAT